MRSERNEVKLMPQLTVWQEFLGFVIGSVQRESSAIPPELRSQIQKFERIKAARICGQEYQKGRRCREKQRQRDTETKTEGRRTRSGDSKELPSGL